MELEQKQKELATNKKLIDSFTSPQYLKINGELKDITGKLNAITISNSEYMIVLSELKEISDKHRQQSNTNLYSLQISDIVKRLDDILAASVQIDFSVVENNRQALSNELTSKRNELKKYLSDKGLTEENLKDISNANIINNNLELDIKNKHEDIGELQRKIDSFETSKASDIANQYTQEVEKQIKSTSEILEKLGSSSVKPISLEFEFDKERAYSRVFDDFKLVFEGQISRSNHKGDTILKEILFCVMPDELTDREGLIEEISNYPSSSAAKNFLIELFTKDENFEIYKLLCEKTFLHRSDYKKIKVLYDNRIIENSSFGQRCTAVIVILLLLGNNPIIIDEPEAHLDSLLISNYLVDVIKDKKQNRQIVFATHNANFVINGDAELIHILDVEETTGITKITSTTIENETTRDILISLEGGKDAFVKRENKYQVIRANQATDEKLRK